MDDLDIPVFFLPKHCTLWVVAMIVGMLRMLQMLLVMNEELSHFPSVVRDASTPLSEHRAECQVRLQSLTAL